MVADGVRGPAGYARRYSKQQREAYQVMCDKLHLEKKILISKVIKAVRERTAELAAVREVAASIRDNVSMSRDVVASPPPPVPTSAPPLSVSAPLSQPPPGLATLAPQLPTPATVAAPPTATVSGSLPVRMATPLTSKPPAPRTPASVRLPLARREKKPVSASSSWVFEDPDMEGMDAISPDSSVGERSDTEDEADGEDRYAEDEYPTVAGSPIMSSSLPVQVPRVCSRRLSGFALVPCRLIYLFVVFGGCVCVCVLAQPKDVVDLPRHMAKPLHEVAEELDEQENMLLSQSVPEKQRRAFYSVV